MLQGVAKCQPAVFQLVVVFGYGGNSAVESWCRIRPIPYCFVIQPMMWEELAVLKDCKITSRGTATFEEVTMRMQRYASILERLVSPEGTFPVFGRSITYRLGVFQPLALLAWKEKLPEGVTNGQARAVMSVCMKRLFANDSIFNSAGFLQLGLPSNHPFWTDKAQNWTSKKAWNGQSIPRDHALKK